MAEVKIAKEKCKGCELCVTYCPKKNLRMSSDVNSRGYHFPEFSDPETCTACKLCALICPDVVLEIYK